MEQTIYEVSQVNHYIKTLLDSNAALQSICVRGELSNYKIYPSGHHYFSLKDAKGAMRCVMFAGAACKLRFRPENGMKVVVSGQITVFERDGAYQLYCHSLIPEGVGDLHIAFEQLKQKLYAEGLFDPAHKKQIPKYPHRVAIITSGAGAALHDMLRVLGSRYPLAEVVVLPVRVQGVEAPPEICGAIRYANRFHVADVIITGRGGGSMEDLWAFNDERVAREIYQSEIPIISAVGHEPDVTISDFVADLRAATPSNGAELVSPDQMELRQSLRHFSGRLEAAVTRRIKVDRERLSAMENQRVLQSPENYLADRRQELDSILSRLCLTAKMQVEQNKNQFIRLVSQLDAMSPLKVLGRGYCVTKNEAGKILDSIGQTAPGEKLRVQLTDGVIHTIVESLERSTL